MKNQLLLLLIFLSFSISNAQSINGQVIDDTSNQLIEDVHVYTKNQKNVTLTNKKGKFKLKLYSPIKENDTIYYSYLGYKIGHSIYSKNKKNYEMFLVRDVNNLKAIHLISNKQLKSFINYTELSPIDKGLYSLGSTLINNKIYVFGGEETYQLDEGKQAFNNDTSLEIDEDFDLEEIFRGLKDFPDKRSFNSNIKVYDIESDLWTTEEPTTLRRSNHSVIYNDDKIYILGGKRMSPNKRSEYLDPQIEVFDVKNKTIEIDNTNPHQAVDFESFIYQDNIIVLGGSLKKFQNGTTRYSDKIHTYNTKTGYWYELGEMKIGKECKGALVNDKIYIFGGYREEELSEFEIFDLMTGEWEEVGNLFTKLSKPAIAHNNQMIFLFEEGKLFTYNTITKELNQFSIGLQLNDAEMHFYNNKLLIIGGFIETSTSTTSSKGVYSIDIDEFDNTRVKKYQQF